MRVLVIDNYDSFTYNLVQCLGVLGADVVVRRNDRLTVAAALEFDLDAIVVSPGPGRPESAGVSKDLIRAAAGRVPVLGVCLGHQCLATVYGARIVRRDPVHGKTSLVRHDGKGVFAGLDNPTRVARYHSLVVDPDTVPDDLIVTARTDDGTIMGLRHRVLALEGVQFHPESFMTPEGMQIVRSFLTQAARS